MYFKKIYIIKKLLQKIYKINYLINLPDQPDRIKNNFKHVKLSLNLSIRLIESDNFFLLFNESGRADKFRPDPSEVKYYI